MARTYLHSLEQLVRTGEIVEVRNRNSPVIIREEAEEVCIDGRRGRN